MMIIRRGVCNCITLFLGDNFHNTKMSLFQKVYRLRINKNKNKNSDAA